MRLYVCCRFATLFNGEFNVFLCGIFFHKTFKLGRVHYYLLKSRKENVSEKDLIGELR